MLDTWPVVWSPATTPAALVPMSSWTPYQTGVEAVLGRYSRSWINGMRAV